MYIGMDDGIEHGQLRKILGRYRETLTSFGGHGLDNESLKLLIEIIPRIKSLYAPSSDINDEGLLDFVSRAQNIEFIGNALPNYANE
jgi:hypothetical protein